MSSNNTLPRAPEIVADIVGILKYLPIMDSEEKRRATAINAGLDAELLAQLDFKGSPATAVPLIVDKMVEFGQMSNQQEALEAFLSTVKSNVGVDRRDQIENLIQTWRALPEANKRRTSRLAGYLKYIVDTWDFIESPLLPADVRFSQIAVHLKVHDTGGKSGETAKVKLPGYQRKDAGGPTRGVELGELLEELSQTERWIILGDPGTGKTTLLLIEAARLAQLAMRDETRPVPAFISLAAFAVQAEKQNGYSIFDHIDAFGKNLALNDLGDEFRKLSLKGRVVFLLDGLDEIGDGVRKSITDRILAAIPSGVGNRIIYTSRKVGFAGPQGFALLEIEPLTLDEQRLLMLAICGKEKTALLLKNIAGRRDLRDMASVPMALTVLALVARETGDNLTDYLHRQADLLHVGTQILLEGRHKNGAGVVNPERAEDVLGRASFQLHNQLVDHASGETFSLGDFEKAVETAEAAWLTPWKGPRDFIKDVSTQSNIIYPVDVLKRNYRYLHRTFREFLSALELSKIVPEERRKFVSAHFNQQKWAEVFVMLGGLTTDVNDYLKQLLNGPPDLALRTLKEVKNLDPALASRILQLRSSRLQDRRQVFIELTRKLGSHDRVIDVLRAYLDSMGADVPRADLFFIQEVLESSSLEISKDLLDDLLSYLPTPTSDLVKSVALTQRTLPYWCDVPGGPFLFGAAEDDPNRPSWVPVLTKVNVSPFQVGRVPVTNAIYEVFDPSHKDLRDFQDEVEPEELDHHPVVMVSWYEAMMFCHWLATSCPGVRLPTETEWEKAASWDTNKKRRFPWGDDWNPTLLNSWERGPNRTTPVGSYWEGRSPCGALDMAGNVWEWCLDSFEENVEDTITRLEIKPIDPRGPKIGPRRVDRGGGWYQDVGQPCTFLRAADEPGDSFSHCGFRLVRSQIDEQMFNRTGSLQDDRI